MSTMTHILLLYKSLHSFSSRSQFVNKSVKIFINYVNLSRSFKTSSLVAKSEEKAELEPVAIPIKNA